MRYTRRLLGGGYTVLIMKITQKLTVIILTYNCADRIHETLDYLKKLPAQPALLAVDNASSDETVSVVRASGIPVIELKKNIGGAARNGAVRQAVTPYVAFCDDDTWWENGSLAKVVRYFDTYPDLAVITAKIIVEPKGEMDPICDEMQHSPLPSGTLPGHKIVSFMGGASAMRRDTFLSVGGYERKLFLGGEEELLATEIMVQGSELRYLPDVVVHHHPSRASTDNLRWYGVRNALWFVWRRRSVGNAWRWTKHIYRTSKHTVFLKGFAGFIAGLPWVMRTRRAIPPKLEYELELVDEQRLNGGTRSYGKNAV